MTFEINIHTSLCFTGVITLCWYRPQTAINTLFLTQRLVFVQEFIDFLSFYFCVYFVTIVILVFVSFHVYIHLHSVYPTRKYLYTRVLTTTEPRLSFFSTKHQICNRKRASQWLFNRSPLYTTIDLYVHPNGYTIEKVIFPFLLWNSIHGRETMWYLVYTFSISHSLCMH